MAGGDPRPQEVAQGSDGRPRSATRRVAALDTPPGVRLQNASAGDILAVVGYSSSGIKTAMAGAKTRILAVDYGRVRIGLAIAESPRGAAQPLDTLMRVNRNEDMRRLREIVRTHSVKLVLVGLPLRLDGSRGAMAEEAERFAGRIRKQAGVPVEMADERLSSWEAERLLEEEYGRRPKAGGQASKKKGGPVTVDSMAAVVILRDYLSRRSGSDGGAST